MSLEPVMFAIVAILGTAFAAPYDPIPKVKEPVWMADFRANYELKDGEYIKRVAPPYIPERIDFMVNAFQPSKGKEAEKQMREMFLDDGQFFTLLVEQSGKSLKKRYLLSSMGLKAMRRGKPPDNNLNNLFEVQNAVEYATGRSSPEFIVDPKHANDPLFAKGNLTVHGDFVVRKKAPLEKLAPQLETILVKECGVPVQLRVEMVEQPVYVAKGKFEIKPPEWRTKSAKERLRKLIDVYATKVGLNPEYDHFAPHPKTPSSAISDEYSGQPTDFLRFLGERTKTRIVWDEQLPSEPYFSWCSHTVKEPTSDEEKADANPELVLKNISPQIGMTFAMEKRKVPVMIISPRKENK